MSATTLTEIHHGLIKRDRLDLADGARVATYDVAAFDQATFQASLVSGSWTSAVITGERSINGADWFAFGSAVTFSASGLTATLDTKGINFVRFYVSDTGTGLIDLTGKGWTQP